MYVCIVYVFWEKVNDMLKHRRKNKIKAGGETRKIGKRMALIVSAILILGMVSIGGLLTFYGTITNETSVGVLFEINDNSTGSPSGWNDAEEYTINYDTSGIAPGDSVEWEFKLMLSSDADASKTMNFIVTDNETEGVNVSILCGGSDITSKVFAPGETITFVYRIETDICTPSGVYNTTVMLTAS